MILRDCKNDDRYQIANFIWMISNHNKKMASRLLATPSLLQQVCGRPCGISTFNQRIKSWRIEMIAAINI